MTIQEAISCLKADKEYLKDNNICDGKEIDAAIEALEKHIPKKPIGDLNSVPHYRCPVCKNAVVLYEYSAKLPHCQWCGQKLDWDDEEYVEPERTE